MPPTEFTNGQLADALDAAADRIILSGWAQHVDVDYDDRVCTLGALWGMHQDEATESVVCDVDGTLAILAAQRLRTHLNTTQAYLGVSISAWNDRPERTEDEVIEELRLTAKELREL